MSNYINYCPGCDSTKQDIGMFGSYFDVYECNKCEHRFCYKCPDSNGGRACPRCGGDRFQEYGRVSK